MSSIKFSLLALTCWSWLFCGAQTLPAGTPPQPNRISRVQQTVQLVRSGVRRQADGSRISLWAIMMGDTENAERIAHAFNWLGPHGLDATLWTRTADPVIWAQTTFRRPRNVDEALAWREHAEAFTSRLEGDAALLPPPFDGLRIPLIARVEFVIAYDDGSAKAYLYPGTSTSAAEEVLTALTESAP